MPRNEAKAKSGRKALRDLSNNNGGRFSKPVNLSKKEDRCSTVVEEDDALDRLLLVQSDLSSIVHQIDELVVQAFKVKATSKHGRKEIESFTVVLSEMLSSLKPWVPRFQEALSSPVESENQLGQTGASRIVSSTNEVESDNVKSPEQTKLDSLISPSPLVSWRADCAIDRGRQLFLLTPLPISKSLASKRKGPSESMFERITSNTSAGPPSFLTISGDINDDLLEGVPIKPTPSKPSDSAATEMRNTVQCEFVSSPMFSKKDHSMLVMTPCLKMSPPKSCVLLEPISETSHQGNNRVHKSTPYPVGIHCRSSQLSDSSGSDASEGLALKYPELLGIQQAYKPGIGKKKIEASPNWFMSPPKSCVVLEPPDEKSLDNAANDDQLPMAAQVPNQQMNLSLSKIDDAQRGCHQNKKSCNQEPLGGSSAFIESTPMWKGPESTIQRGKRPGENTLKKELWTRFEAATTHGLRFNVSVVQSTNQKGFLDLLDEASCEEDGGS